MAQNKKKSSNNKGRKGKDKRDFRGDKHPSGLNNVDSRRVHTDAEREDANDVAWYTLYPQLVYDACNLNYGYPLGSKLDLGAYQNPNFTLGENESVSLTANKNWTVPGIMLLQTIPTVGETTDRSSPVNMTADNMYGFIRKSNSGSANYDACDLMLYCLTMDSIYSLHSFLKRIYGMMRMINPMNRYIYKAAIQGMGVDFDDVAANLSQFRAMINLMAVKAGCLCVPASMSYFARHMWMYSGIYRDEDITKSQMYAYTPYSFWKYNEYDGAGQLDYVPFVESIGEAGLWKVSELSELVEELLGAAVYSQDVNIMSGDILKAYGEGNVFKLSLTPEEYVVEPTFNAEVLIQIHNAYVFNAASMVISPITQDPNNGTLIQTIGVSSDVPILERRKIISLPTNTPTPELTMVATRCTAIPEPSEGGATLTLRSFGSEVIGGAYICKFDIDSDGVWNPLWYPFQSDIVLSADDGYSIENTQKLRLSNLLDSFQFHPEVRIYTKNHNGSKYFYTNVGRKFNVYNFSLLDADELQAMHTAALMSEFYVPVNGALIK